MSEEVSTNEKPAKKKSERIKRRSSRIPRDSIKKLFDEEAAKASDDSNVQNSSSDLKLDSSTEQSPVGPNRARRSNSTNSKIDKDMLNDLLKKKKYADEEAPENQQPIDAGKKKKEEFVRTSTRNKSPKQPTGTRRKDRPSKHNTRGRTHSVEFFAKDNSKAKPSKKRPLAFPKLSFEGELDANIWWEFKSKEEMYEIDLHSRGRKSICVPKVPPKNIVKEVDQICKKYIEWDRVFDNYESVAAALVKKSNDPEFYLYPENDITVEYQKKQHPIYPEEKFSYHVNQCFEYLTGDHQLYQRNYAHYGGVVSFGKRVIKTNQAEKQKEQQESKLEKKDTSICDTSTVSSTGEGSVESSYGDSEDAIDSLRMIQLDDYLVNSRSDDPEREQIEIAHRVETHISMFGHFRPPSISQKPTDPRVLGHPFQAQYAAQIILEAKAISFSLDSFFKEPFWIEFSFYDIKLQSRISETMYVDFNSDDPKTSPSTKQPVDSETDSKIGIFSFSSTSESIYLVVRVVSTFHGEIDATCEPYVKGNTMSEKDRIKWKEETEQGLQTLGKYKQAMAWGAIPVFGKGGKLLIKESFHDIPLFKMKPILTDEIFYETMENPEKRPRKALDGQVAISAKSYNPTAYRLRSHVDYSLYPIPSDPKTEEDFSKKSLDKIVKSMYNFGSELTTFYPHTALVNNFYIYPQAVNMSTFTAKQGKIKSVICRMSVLTSDEAIDVDKFGLEAIYGQSHTKNFVHTIELPISFNNKRPVFYDEIKIKLPFHISSKLHILISWINLNVSTKNTGELENVLGYSVLPILNSEKRIIDDGEHDLVIYQNLGPDYLAKKDTQSLIKSDGKSHNGFQVRIKLASSIFTNNTILHRFFKASENIESINPQTIEPLPQIDRREMIELFPIIFNRLFTVMTKASTNVQHLAWRALVQLVKLIDEQTKGESPFNNLLVTYLNYTYNIGQTQGQNESARQSEEETYDRIIKHWTTLIVESGLSSETRALLDVTMNDHPYFFFGLIVKSMVLQLQKENLLNATDRTKKFSPETKLALSKLIQGFSCFLSGPSSGPFSRMFVSQLALFINDLLGIMDRGFVFTLIHDFIRNLVSEKKSMEFLDRKIEFFRIITDYEHYVQLILPTDDTVDSATTMPLKFWKDHYLSGYLLHEIDQAVEHGNPEIQTTAIRLLREVLWKHTMDDRYKDHAVRRQMVANAYLPQLRYTVLRVSQILKEDEKLGWLREWLLCFMYVLRFCKSDLVRQWWRLEEKQHLLSLIDYFTISIDTLKKQEKESMDANFLGEISLTMVEYLEYFMQDFAAEFMQKVNLGLFEKLSNLLLLLLKVNTVEDVLLSILSTMRVFFFEFKLPLFRYLQTTFCIDCCFDLFNKCFYESTKVATYAMSLIYAMMKANYLEMSEFLRMKLSATVAISKLDQKHYPRFLHVLEVLLLYARNKDNDLAPDWLLHVHDLLSRLYRIIHYTLLLPDIKDPEYEAEVLSGLSYECIHSVDLRVKWYQVLASVHNANKNYEEVGQCKVFVSALIAAFLIKKGDTDTSYLPQSYESCKLISPNIIYELPLMEECTLVETVSPVLFHEQGYMSTIHEAIDAMVKANMFEEGVELLSILFDLHRLTGNFSKLIGVGKTLWELAEKADKAIESNTRLFSNYYRVCFYGPKFRKLHNTKYIYRESSSVRLVDFSDRMVKQFSDKFGEDVKVLPNKPIEELHVEVEKHYLQIISVTAFQEPNRLKLKKTVSTWDKQHGVNTFGFEAPWAGPNGGKPSDEVSKQWKIRYLFVTPQFYPGNLLRLKVIEEKKEKVGPLDCAIDLIDSRIELIKLELQLRPPNTKTLQIVLQGSIMLQVNAGPRAIMQYFLGNHSTLAKDNVYSFDQKKIAILREKLVEFIRKCDFALRLNKKLIDESQKEYQEAMKEHFDQLKSEAGKYLQL